MMKRFESDYLEGAHPDVLRALIETNGEQTPGYGEDPHCEAARALLREYKKLQMQLQLAAVAGAEVSNDDTQRFQQIGALLFAGENTSRFLLLEMCLQQTMADVFKALSDAAGLDMLGM